MKTKEWLPSLRVVAVSVYVDIWQIAVLSKVQNQHNAWDHYIVNESTGGGGTMCPNLLETQSLVIMFHLVVQ